MPDTISHKLGAYLDGELDRRGQLEVQAHLETCPACRTELEELRLLSGLLRTAPQPDFTPALDFKAQIMLQLPRRELLPVQQGQDARPGQAAGHLLPWIVPVLVLLGWICIQMILGLSTLVSYANQAGFLGGAAAWFAGGPQQMQWFELAQAMLGGILNPQGQVGLTLLNDASLFTQNLVIALLLQVGAALFYWGALALVWHYKVKALWSSPVAG